MIENLVENYGMRRMTTKGCRGSEKGYGNYQICDHFAKQMFKMPLSEVFTLPCRIQYNTIQPWSGKELRLFWNKSLCLLKTSNMRWVSGQLMVALLSFFKNQIPPGRLSSVGFKSVQSMSVQLGMNRGDVSGLQELMLNIHAWEQRC